MRSCGLPKLSIALFIFINNVFQDGWIESAVLFARTRLSDPTGIF